MADVQRLTERQKYLLIIIEQHENGIGREKLTEKAPVELAASRATIIRDLNTLLAQNLVYTSGSGPSTLYLPRTAGELLRYYDLPMYFGHGPDERTLTAQSNIDFIHELKVYNMLFDEEKAELNEANGRFQERLVTRNPDILKREQERFTIELAWKSSRIEGNTYSLLETEELIKTAREVAGHSSEEAQMILNHKEALEMIGSHREEYRRLNIETIERIHAILVAGLGVDTGIRNQPVGIVGTLYQPPESREEIADDLRTVLDIVNDKNNPVEAAIIASALIAYLQPFSDGNKRTARLVGNAVLIANDYAPLSYRSVDEIVYKEAVLLIDEQHSFYWYKKLFIEQFNFTCEKYFI